MANEVLVITTIFDESVTDIINQVNSFPDNEDVTLILNSPGGSVFAAWALIGKLLLREGDFNVNVMGVAASMGAMFPVFAKSTEALDVTQFMIHKASGSFFADESEKQMIAKINDDLHKKLKSKINIAKFKEITGKSLKSVFESEEVVDVWLTAQQAKSIGLIDKVTATKTQNISAFTESIAAHYKGEVIAQADPPKVVPQPQIKNIMNLDKLRSENPDVYADAVAVGVAKEKDRAGAWMAYADIDLKAVKEGIKGGEMMSQTVQSEMQVKALSTGILNDAEDSSANSVTTPDPVDSAAALEDAEKFEGTPEAIAAFQEGVTGKKE